MKPFLPLVVVALPFVSAAGADGSRTGKLEYRTPAGVTYVVTADGLSEVRLGGRILARGGWRFGAADRQWGFAGTDAGPVTDKSIKIVSRTEARVTHVHAQAAVRHTFTFAGEDVRVESYVENR